jgi:chemosensory pili system protein ChpA (sensor histidine kinase/response regulator)
VVAAPAVSPWAGFGALELDRYDDIHVLSRGLAEIANDSSEVDLQVLRELSDFADVSEALSTIVTGIQSEITRARMVPLESVFTRLRFAAREAATREGKQMRFQTSGEDVQLDKTMVDSLFAPLLHLVRNSVAHGIESEQQRTAARKDPVGTVTLAARQESGQIVIEVSDDGGGLDLGALHKKGVAMGLITKDTSVNDPSIKELVFAKGLSTKSSAGAVAGRGQGGDIVKRTIESLNGNILVDSTPRAGTRFMVTLPLTLAITRAVLVRYQERSYAIPLYFAERILAAQDVKTVESAGMRRLSIDGALIPLRELGEAFGSAKPGRQQGPVVMLKVGNNSIALEVDAVIGQEEIVVKQLGELLHGHPLFSGMTVRGTGELVLIVDVPGVIEAIASGGKIVPRPAAVVDVEGREVDEELQEALAVKPAPQKAPVVPVPAPHRGHKTRVLFVDDSISVRKVAERTLAGLGVEVFTAVDGIDALAKLREVAVDMVFTDLEMPRMHGYELIREIRFVPAYAGLPVVVVSSRSGAKHQEQARSLGATDYLTKPFTAETLRDVIQRLVGSKRAN